MNITRTTTLRLIKISLAVIIVVVIAAYAVWRSIDYTRGPEIDIFEPANGSTIDSSTVLISGKAVRVNAISLNGHVISVDREGNFKEMFVVFPGINKFTFVAKDRFGRTITNYLDIVGSSSLPEHKTAATTTSTSTEI